MTISVGKNITIEKKEEKENVDAQLEVILTQTRNRTPLVTVNNLPGRYADFTPQQLRALAVVLCKAADEAETHPMNPKYFKQKRRLYDIR